MKIKAQSRLEFLPTTHIQVKRVYLNIYQQRTPLCCFFAISAREYIPTDLIIIELNIKRLGPFTYFICLNSGLWFDKKFLITNISMYLVLVIETEKKIVYR